MKGNRMFLQIVTEDDVLLGVPIEDVPQAVRDGLRPQIKAELSRLERRHGALKDLGEKLANPDKENPAT